MSRKVLAILVTVIVVAVVALTLGLVFGLNDSNDGNSYDEPEYRALWIATVENVDWPLSNTAVQATNQQELLYYFDLMAEMNMNAVFFQIRPHMDALYNSQIEPWSEYLTGKQGLVPSDPYWDPLEFAVQEGHARGIEVHAWLNPYRAKKGSTNRTELASNHMCITHSQYCYDYGPDLWMDPGVPAIVDRFIDVVLDIINRYNVDGVHIDDYFYPWPVGTEEFPDDTTYLQYQNEGGKLSRDDWRRDNVNRMVRRFYHEVKLTDPSKIVSISPFGLYKPGAEDGMPPPIVGTDPYEVLYADTRRWIEEGWMDLFVPQIYWDLGSTGQPYQAILEWWISINIHNIPIVAGNALYKIEPPWDWPIQELPDQIEVTRSLEGAHGNCIFSAKFFRDNTKGSVDAFKEVYQVAVDQSEIPPYRGREEHRGLWLATVDNIDWPLSKNAPQDTQRQELLDYLEMTAEMNMNALYFQMRSEGDAMYNSSFEPWSEYLTGSQGVAPDPYWDPLEVAIQEGHARGIEIHAWLNPFRASIASPREELAAGHMCLEMPQYCYDYGTYLWMDPGAPEVQNRFLDVVADIIDRYDVDGIHIDDYFYPWPVGTDFFPDNDTFSQYLSGGGNMSLADWRRGNINNVVRSLYHEVKTRRESVKVSIAPFGIYRAGHPEGMPDPITGSDQYEALYADPKKWLQEGWMDMLIPQIYWNIDSPGQPFVPILDWWLSVNPQRKWIVPGNALYKMRSDYNDWPVSELINQVDETRKKQHYGAEGTTMFSAKYFRDDLKQCKEAFMGQLYTDSAIMPTTPQYTPEN